MIPQNWSFHNDHVDKDVEPGKFMSAESVFIAAGPPELPAFGGTTLSPEDIWNPSAPTGMDADTQVFPIGVVENLGLAQNKQVQRIFEIGSSVSFFVPGRTVGSMNLTRVMYHGRSLLRVLYANYKSDASPYPFGALTINPTDTGINPLMNPGYDDYFINLGSDLFNQPFGAMFYMMDQLENPVAAVYAENCHPASLQTSINSGSVLIMEGVAFEFSKLKPIRVTDIGVA